MRGSAILIMAVLVVAGLAGCGERKPPAQTFADPQVQALKKAREVEGKLAESAARNRAAIEQSSGARNEP